MVAATLALAPMFHDRPFVVHGLTMTLALVLSGLVFSATRSRLLTGVAFGLALTYESLSLLAVDPGLRAVGAAASGCFYALSACVIVAVVWREKDVTADTILGGIAVYLMLGLVFALLYSIVEIVAPGSFLFANQGTTSANLENTADRFPVLLYFSYVTMTTLGYGDVVPITGFTGGLATTQAITGQLFLAILMARLVGLYIAQQMRN